MPEIQEEFLKLKNVHSCGIGYKESKYKLRDMLDRLQGKKSIIAFVEKKLPKEELDPNEIVPEEYKGMQTDVQEIGVLEPLRSKERPVVGGCSGMIERWTACTIGAIVFRGDKPYILSNEHCLDRWFDIEQVGGKILQPSPADGGKLADAIATLVNTEHRLNLDGKTYNLFDSSIQPLEEGIPYRELYQKQIGEIKNIVATVKPGEIVQKRGRTTGLTSAPVIATDVYASVRYGMENPRIAMFRNQIFARNRNWDFVNGGDSVAEDTMLYWRDNGKVKYGTIKELYENFNDKIEVLAVKHKNENYKKTFFPSVQSATIDWCKVEDALYHGVKDVYEATLRDGKRIKVTEDHSLFSSEGQSTELKVKTIKDADNFISVTKEIETGEGDIGDIVELMGLWTADGSWIKEKKVIEFKDNNISIPKRKHKEGDIVTWIKGIYISTGGDQKIVDFLSNFGDPIHKSKGDYRIYSGDLAKKLISLGLEENSTSHTKRVPKWIFTASKKDRERFLRGYFSGDGSMYERCGRAVISCSSVNRDLVDDIQTLLSSLGIRSNLCSGYLPTGSFKSKNLQYKLNIEWRGSVKKFYKTIGFINKGYEPEQTPPVNEERELSTREIRSIEYVGKEPVYDLKVRPYESFVANGILCHNSGSLCLNMSKEIVGNLYAGSGGSGVGVIAPIQPIMDAYGFSFVPTSSNGEFYCALGRDWYVEPQDELITVVRLNARTSPVVSRNTLIRTMPTGTRLKVIENIGTRGGYRWCKVIEI